jgi:hypothetical protein
METNWNQLIDRYLSRELSEDGKIAFDQLRKENPDFEQAYQLHCLVIEGVKRINQRLVIQQLGKTYHRTQKIKLYALIVVVLVALASLSYYFVNRSNKETPLDVPITHVPASEQTDINEVKAQGNLNDKDGTSTQLNNAEAGKNNDSMYNRLVDSKNSTIQKSNGKNGVYQENRTESREPTMIYFEPSKPMEELTPPKEQAYKMINPSTDINRLPATKITKVYASFPINKSIRKVQIEGKFGAIDSLNNFVIQPIYDSLELIAWNKMTNEKGEREVQILFSVISTSSLQGHFYWVKKDQLYYLFDEHFQMITPNGYDKIGTQFIYKQYIKVLRNGKYGLISEKGIEVVPCEYDDIRYRNGLKGELNGEKVRINIE